MTSDLIATESITLIDVLLDGDDVDWIESRPQQGGRYVVVRHAKGGTIQDVKTLLGPNRISGRVSSAIKVATLPLNLPSLRQCDFLWRNCWMSPRPDESQRQVSVGKRGPRCP
jgi:hypothetical protein